MPRGGGANPYLFLTSHTLPDFSPSLLYCRYRPIFYKASPKKQTTFFRKNTVVNFGQKKSTIYNYTSIVQQVAQRKR